MDVVLLRYLDAAWPDVLGYPVAGRVEDCENATGGTTQKGTG